MARINNLENFLQDVANAIKAKKEYQSSQKIAAEDFDTEISSISTLKGEQVIINPSKSQQIITPSTGKNAITQATVNAVTSSIDSNIQAGNIKSGIEILGVLGTYEGSGGGIDKDNIIAAHSLLTIANGNNSPYTGVGDTYENDFEILNIALPTEDTYSGAGGTDTQILANLNLILGIAS